MLYRYVPIPQHAASWSKLRMTFKRQARCPGRGSPARDTALPVRSLGRQVPQSEGQERHPPLYAEICIYYIDQIYTDTIKPGQLLPSAWRSAEQYGVSPRTARRGVQLLSTLGLGKADTGYPYMALLPQRN
jgi:hypothetical protein